MTYISQSTIRAIFLESGLTIKPGEEDLKSYLFVAAHKLIDEVLRQQTLESRHKAKAVGFMRPDGSFVKGCPGLAEPNGWVIIYTHDSLKVQDSEDRGLNDDSISKIAEALVDGMEGGIQGFAKYWGWSQFAKALIQYMESVNDTYQGRAQEWSVKCFGKEVAGDQMTRVYRFLEEALELAQAGGASQEDAKTLVEYVFNRPLGQMTQEVGGVMVTLATLCAAFGMDMDRLGERGLADAYGRMDEIRKKQASKPLNSPLPGSEK